MTTKSKNTLRFMKGKSEHRVKKEDIIRLEGKVNYTLVYTKNQSFLSSKTLKEYQYELNSSDFIRTHKSHIINRIHVISTDFQKGQGQVELRTGDKVDVSRRRLREVKRLLSPHRLTL
ncbi:LytTR family DNA-binding domain-containing protein [Jiulongibacter sediminis]|jgi:two-component system LytT family response regulator|uniref:LytR/AlgR family response regulator transcription factor n=1 Tax=Jiulongibacter sediminis TaxID=1605367 RepID=UPI0026EEDA84|nr:LytTR family DNA-binding domain-containing protein [Jiulongibacter sediminis]